MIYVFLSVMFFFFQNVANKEYGERFPTTPRVMLPFHIITHIAMLISLAITGIDFSLPPLGYLYSFLYGLNFVLAINILMKTLKLGSIGKTTLIVNLSMLLPMLLGVIFWGESLDVYKLLGIPCVVLCLVLSVSFKGKQETGGASNLWTVFVFIMFFLDGSLSVIQQLFLKNCTGASSNAFVTMSVVFGLGICTLSSLAFAAHDKRLAFPVSQRRGLFLLLALIIGASTALATVYNMLALDTLKEGLIVFPVRQGGLILMITVFGIFRYKEKFGPKTAVMLVSGIAGIVLLNL